MKALRMRKNDCPGRLITFCGLDGSGKSTMIDLLTDAWRAQGKRVFVTKQPTDFVRNSDIFRNFQDYPSHEGYDDHAKISFGDETEPPETESVEMTYPEYIVDCIELTYCPEGYIKGNVIQSSVTYIVDYYNADGEKVFSVSQYVIDDTDMYVDNELGIITKINIREPLKISTPLQ